MVATPVTATPGEGQACAVLQPALAEAARRTGARAVGLVDVGRGLRPWATLNLRPDRVATVFADGRVLGDPGSSVRLACRLVGDRVLPTTPLPAVVARLGPVPDPQAALAAALAEVPPTALPVLLTTWALSRFDRARRERFVEAFARAGRPCAWLSVEGVGVGPGVPTLGDRPASGHSLVGLALADGSGGPLEPEVLARCWSRGRVLAWLAPDPDRDPATGEGTRSPPGTPWTAPSGPLSTRMRM